MQAFAAARKNSILYAFVAVIFITAAIADSPGIAADHVIEINGFNFAPVNVEVEAGDRVTWINRDIVPHTASAGDGGWDSGEIAPGAQKTLRLPAAFERRYLCRYHPAMQGKL